MKNITINLIFIFSMSFFIYSCTNDFIAPNELKGGKISLDINNIEHQNFPDSLYSLELIDSGLIFINPTIAIPYSDYMIFDNLKRQMMDEDIYPMQHTGYQLLQSSGDKMYVGAFSSDLVEQAGLNTYWDYFEYKIYVAALRVGTPTPESIRFIFGDSPNCGYNPNKFKENPIERGYRVVPVPNSSSFVMQTYICNILGDSHHIYEPKKYWLPCHPDQIIWDFGYQLIK